MNIPTIAISYLYPDSATLPGFPTASRVKLSLPWALGSSLPFPLCPLSSEILLSACESTKC